MGPGKRNGVELEGGWRRGSLTQLEVWGVRLIPQ